MPQSWSWPTMRVMATAGDVFHNPITGERLTVLLGADDTDGRYLAAAMQLPAGDCRARPHAHPELVEAVQVRRGELAVTIEREERRVRAGERIVFPRGTRHDFCNAGPGDAELVLEVWPARRFELLMGTLMGLAREGSTDASGTPDPLQLAVIAREFSGELRWCSGPGILRDTAFAVLAPLGRLFGRRPYYERHAAPADRVAVVPWRERPVPAC